MISPGLAVPDWLTLGYWPALIVAPLIVGAFGLLLEKTIISRLYKLDHLYGLLLTFGLALVLEGLAPQRVRQLRHALPDPAGAAGRHQSRLHVHAELSRLGGRGGRWWSAWPPG